VGPASAEVTGRSPLQKCTGAGQAFNYLSCSTTLSDALARAKYTSFTTWSSVAVLEELTNLGMAELRETNYPPTR